MKKILGLLIVATFFAPLFAGARDSADGCGLGWEVTDKMTFLATTTRATTNAFVPPTFGMTTGTLGCTQLSLAKNEQEAASFVVNNYQPLKKELSEGRGEYVDAMTEAFGCSKAQAAVIGNQIQKNYSTVVAPSKNGADLYKNLKKEISCTSAS